MESEKMYSIEDLKHAYKAGVFDSQIDSHIADDIDNAFDEYVRDLESQRNKVEEEPTFRIYYAWIKYNCGWSRYCDVTGGNHYAINEFGEFDDNHSFTITQSEAKQLGYIKQ